MDEIYEIQTKLNNLPLGNLILSNPKGMKLFNSIASSENGIDTLYEIVNNKNTPKILSTVINDDAIDQILENPMLPTFVSSVIVNNNNAARLMKNILNDKNTVKIVENFMYNPEDFTKLLSIQRNSESLMSFFSRYFTCDTSKDILYALQDNCFFPKIYTSFFEDPNSLEMMNAFMNMKDYQRTFRNKHIKNFIINTIKQNEYIDGYKQEFMMGKFFRSALSKRTLDSYDVEIYNKLVYVKLTLFLFRMGMYYADEHIELIDSSLKRTPLRIGYKLLKAIVMPLYRDYDSIVNHINPTKTINLYDIMEKHIYNFPVEFHKKTLTQCVTEKDLEVYPLTQISDLGKSVNYLVSTLNHYLDFLVVVAKIAIKLIF